MSRTASRKARSQEAVARGVGGPGVGKTAPQWQLDLAEEIDALGVTPTRLAQILVQYSANSSVEHLVEQACTRLQDLWIEQSSTNTYEAGLAAELKAAGLLVKHVPEKFQFLRQRL